MNRTDPLSEASTSLDQLEWREERGERRKRYIVLGLIFLVLALISALTLNVRWDRMGDLQTIIDTIFRFWPPDISTWPDFAGPVLETIMMALLSTVISMVISLPVIVMAARNINLPFNNLFYGLGRLIIVLSRSIHELVWALFFVTALGLGAFPGVLALSVRSIGFVSKMMAESVENIRENEVEAIEATGANRLQVWVFGIIPQIIPTLIGIFIFRWDVNLRASTILGVVGAGGIGYHLDLAMSTYNYDEASAIILIILIMVGLGEIISSKLREKYVKESEGD